MVEHCKRTTAGQSGTKGSGSWRGPRGPDPEELLAHGLAKPHLPVRPKTKDGSSTVVPAFSAVRVTDHGGKHPVDGNGPGAERHGHGDERREYVNQ
jgi:hypothetical protein